MQRINLEDGIGPYVFQCLEQDKNPVTAEVSAFSGPDRRGNPSTVILLSEAPENEGPSLTSRIPQISQQVCQGIGIENAAAPSVKVLEYQPAIDEKPEVFREIGLQWRPDGLMTENPLRTRELSREQVGDIVGEENLPQIDPLGPSPSGPSGAQEPPQHLDLSEESFTGAAAQSQFRNEPANQTQPTQPDNDIGIDI